MVLRPQTGEFWLQILCLLFGLHSYVRTVNPAQQKPFSASFCSDKIPFSLGQGGRKQNRVEVVEGLFLDSSPDSDFISADVRPLIQTPLHLICTSSSRIQAGRLQQILSDKCIDCIFQFLWQQQYCSDLFGLMFLSGDYSQFWSLSCIVLQREVCFMQSVWSSCSVPSDCSFLQSVPVIWHY